MAKGGVHLMTDDLFIAARETESEKEIVELEKVKRKRLAAILIYQAVNIVMQQKGNEIQQLQFSSLTVLALAHYFVGTIYIWGR